MLHITKSKEHQVLKLFIDIFDNNPQGLHHWIGKDYMALIEPYRFLPCTGINFILNIFQPVIDIDVTSY